MAIRRGQPPLVKSVNRSKLGSVSFSEEQNELAQKILLLHREFGLLSRRRLDYEEIELEVRLGVTPGKSGTNDLYWINAYDACKNLPGVKKKWSRIYDIRLDTGDRSASFRKRQYGGKEGVWQLKKTVNQIDVSDYWARISLNVESLTHQPDIDTGIINRWISRHTFILDNARIDFSKSISNGELTNEIEIEYIPGVKGYDINRFIEICLQVSTFMHNTPLPFKYSDLEAVGRMANTYLTKDHIATYSSIDRSYLSEARNLTLGEINYKKLFRSEYVDKKPGNDKRKTNERNWWLLRKVDGERMMLVVCNLGTWLIFPPYQARLLSLEEHHIGLPFTMIDCELYSTNLYFIHSLFLDGDDVRGCNFSESQERAIEWRDNNSNSLPQGMDLIFRKPILATSSNFFAAVSETILISKNGIRINNGADDINFKDDGIMLTPAEMNYYDLASRTAQILKWKPVITVDLKTMKENGKIKLFSTSKTKEGEIENHPFIGTKSNPFNEMIDFKNIAFNNNSVVEFSWNSKEKQLEAIKNRYDKSGANRPEVAKDNWKRMTQDNLVLDESTIQGRSNKLVKKAHNRIKTTLFREASQRKGISERKGLKLLDLGGGQGGDINKLVDSFGDNKGQPIFRKVYVVEPSDKYIDDYKLRLKEYPQLTDIVRIIKGEGQDTKKIWKFIGEKQVDVISMMDSLTFFFNPNGKDLAKLAETINTCLKPGGSFIWKMLDGDKLRDKFEASSEKILEFGKDIKIERKNENKLLVSILPWIENQPEWLTSVQAIKNIGLIGNEMYAVQEPLLSRNYIEYSELYSYGHFKLGTDTESVSKELVVVLNALVPLKGPYPIRNTAIEALESVFTVHEHRSLVDNYLNLVRKPDENQRKLKNQPAFTYLETALQGRLILEFLNRKSEEAVLKATPNDDISLALADLLQIDVYIVNKKRELIVTNAVNNRENSAIIITKSSENTYKATPIEDEIILAGDHPVLEDYERLEKSKVLDDYSLIFQELDAQEIVSEAEDLSHIIYQRLLYISSNISLNNYYKVAAVGLGYEKVEDLNKDEKKMIKADYEALNSA